MKISKGISNKALKTALYVLYLFLIVFILLEVILRIYDPFKFRIKANRIILPINQKQIIHNSINPRLDSIIINTRNSLGFRGPDTPANFSQQLSIVTVGGSTTECHFLNDEKTWTYRMEKVLEKKYSDLWVNNAGIDGHSSFGHQLLLDDYLVILRPKLIIFLTGVNDIENKGPSFFDKQNTKNAYPDLLHFIYNNSEVVNVAVNIMRGMKAQKFNNTTQELKVPGHKGLLTMSRNQIDQRLKYQQKYLTGYKNRLAGLAETCRKNGILPVFLTQPCLYGNAIDSATGVNLATARVEDEINGQLLDELLDLYNQQVKKVCEEKDLPLIDLASAMPKNSIYYYDQTHYTNQGAELVAIFVAGELKKVINLHFPEFKM